MTTDDSMDDDVFEASEDVLTNDSSRLSVTENDHNLKEENTPSPTGYRGYKPPAEVLKLCESEVIEESDQRIHKVKLFV